MSEKLKPCPFCGHKDIGATDDGYAVCAYCEARMDVDTSNVSWNTRPIEDALRAEVERLNGRFDTAHQVIAHRENECAMLRAEVAALKAELAKYTEPLTQEQVIAVHDIYVGHGVYGNWHERDAAIRRVRRGE